MSPIRPDITVTHCTLMRLRERERENRSLTVKKMETESIMSLCMLMSSALTRNGCLSKKKKTVILMIVFGINIACKFL